MIDGELEDDDSLFTHAPLACFPFDQKENCELVIDGGVEEEAGKDREGGLAIRDSIIKIPGEYTPIQANKPFTPIFTLLDMDMHVGTPALLSLSSSDLPKGHSTFWFRVPSAWICLLLVSAWTF